jgi:hypothetical protein
MPDEEMPQTVEGIVALAPHLQESEIGRIEVSIRVRGVTLGIRTGKLTVTAPLTSTDAREVAHWLTTCAEILERNGP